MNRRGFLRMLPAGIGAAFFGVSAIKAIPKDPDVRMSLIQTDPIQPMYHDCFQANSHPIQRFDEKDKNFAERMKTHIRNEN